MVREYIGARYVPKFMGAFDVTQAYEALCVVDNGMGTSYISKIPTPAGTSLSDTTYWTIYGASNGAIINLQNQIGDLSSLTTLDKDNLVEAINEVNGDVNRLNTYIIVPEKYGAVGDGVTDDTAAINDMFTAAAGIDSVIIAFTKVYLVSGPLIVPSNCKITGNGTLKRNAPHFDIFQIRNQSNIIIDGLTFIGTNDFSEAPQTTGDICIKLSHDIAVYNCTFKYTNDRGGVMAWKSTDVVIAHNHFIDIGAFGIALLGECKSFAIIGNNIENLRDYAHSISYGITCSNYEFESATLGNTYRCEDIVITNNILKTEYAFWEGIDMHGGKDFVIADNVISGFMIGIATVKSNSDNYSCENINISNNTIDVGGTPFSSVTVSIGIDIHFGENLLFGCGVVCNNTIVNSGTTAATYGLSMQSSDVIINDNSIYDCAVGIQELSGVRNVIKNNHIVNATTCAIELYSTYNPAQFDFVGNVFENTPLAFQTPANINPTLSMFYLENNIYHDVTAIVDNVEKVLPDLAPALPSTNKYARQGAKVKNSAYAAVGDVLYWVTSAERHNSTDSNWAAIKTVAI